MSQAIATPPPATAFRRFWRRVWDDPESRSTLIGVLGVVLIHLLLLLLAPYLARIEGVALAPRAIDPSKQFNIEIAPDTFAQPKSQPAPPDRFVETNPDAPTNEPDKTRNFGAHSQQAAQETPTPDGRSDRPATEGKADVDTTQIVSGRLTTPEEQLEAMPAVETPPAVATTEAPRAEQNPLPGFEKVEGDNPLTYGSNVARIPDTPAQPVRERVEGARDVPVVAGATVAAPSIDPTRPRPRPQLTKQPQVRPAVLAENKFGTSNIGLNAWDARWSNYGAYLQRMIDTIQIQWERILVQSQVHPPSGTMVTVKFVLDSEGKIARIVDVANQSTEAGAAACIAGITDRAPYGPWTEDMKQVLGEQQELTFTFHYQ